MNMFGFAKGLTGFWLRLGGMRIIGQENIPLDRAVIIICNHLSLADPPALVQAFPYPLTFIAKEEFSHNIFTKLLFGSMGTVFLNKEESDLSAMRTAMNELKAGRAVAIFPEGHRTFDQGMDEFKPGAAYIAARTGVKVIPVALINTGDFFRIWKRNIIVHVGAPISMDHADKIDSETLTEYTKIFAEKVAELLAYNQKLLVEAGK